MIQEAIVSAMTQLWTDNLPQLPRKFPLLTDGLALSEGYPVWGPTSAAKNTHHTPPKGVYHPSQTNTGQISTILPHSIIPEEF